MAPETRVQAESGIPEFLTEPSHTLFGVQALTPWLFLVYKAERMMPIQGLVCELINDCAMLNIKRLRDTEREYVPYE